MDDDDDFTDGLLLGLALGDSGPPSRHKSGTGCFISFFVLVASVAIIAAIVWAIVRST